MIGESREEGQEYQTLEHDTSEDSGEAHRLRSELGVENDEESRGQRPMRVVNIEVEREQGRRQDLESHCSSGVIGIRIGLTPHARRGHTTASLHYSGCSLPVLVQLQFLPTVILIFALSRYTRHRLGPLVMFVVVGDPRPCPSPRAA